MQIINGEIAVLPFAELIGLYFRFYTWRCNLYFEEKFWASVMFLSLKALATKSENLSSIIGTHMVDRRRQLP